MRHNEPGNLIIPWIRINVTLNTNNQNAFEDFSASVCGPAIYHHTLWMSHYVRIFSGRIQEVLLWLCLCVYTFAFFPQDWWNSTSYSNYYRTWNVVVHDWLYYYAYKDFLWFFTKRLRAVAMLAVFAVSATVHEYALAVSLNFFYPVLFVLFMFFGMAFNFIVNDSRKRPIWNVLMWTSLFAGNAVLLCFYSQEWYARQHCPLKNPTFLDYIRPRSWTCRYMF